MHTQRAAALARVRAGERLSTETLGHYTDFVWHGARTRVQNGADVCCNHCTVSEQHLDWTPPLGLCHRSPVRMEKDEGNFVRVRRLVGEAI